jgi:hypothetical protein
VPALACGGAAAPAAGHSRHSKLVRHPTFAQIDRETRRPKSMPNWANVEEEESDEDDAEGVAQSARAANRSWSLSGGFRDASFKKRAPTPFADANDAGAGAGAGAGGRELKRQASALGFAAVLSVSGWSEADAEEVEIDGGAADGPEHSISRQQSVDLIRGLDGDDAAGSGSGDLAETGASSLGGGGGGGMEARLARLERMLDGATQQAFQVERLEGLLKEATAQLNALPAQLAAAVAAAPGAHPQSRCVAAICESGTQPSDAAPLVVPAPRPTPGTWGIGLGGCCGHRKAPKALALIDATAYPKQGRGERGAFSTPLLFGLLQYYYFDKR